MDVSLLYLSPSPQADFRPGPYRLLFLALSGRNPLDILPPSPLVCPAYQVMGSSILHRQPSILPRSIDPLFKMLELLLYLETPHDVPISVVLPFDPLVVMTVDARSALA